MKKILKLKKNYLITTIILALSIAILSLSFLPRTTAMTQDKDAKKEQSTTTASNSRTILNYGENNIAENDIMPKYGLNASQQSMTNNYQKTSEVIASNNLVNDSQVNVQEEFNLLVDEIEMQGTNVIIELNNQKTYYENLLHIAVSDEEVYKINRLIETTQQLIESYNSYNSNVQTRGGFHLIYSPYVAAVIAGFNISGWTLAAELLTHAVDNNNLDSIYIPVNSSRVFASEQLRNIRNDSNLQGTSSFTKNNTTASDDLYYAIHAFYWSKSYSGRTIVLQDRYDYASGDYGYGSITGTIVELMYQAQNAGAIVPYYSIITYSDNSLASQNSTAALSVSSDSRYIEQLVTLGTSEYREFNITFGRSGNKIFQTFGHKDAYLEIYSSSGSRISYNDDAGYSLNSLIPLYCYANTQYKVRVRFYSSNQNGEIKLAVTPSTGAKKTESTSFAFYEDIWETASSNYTFNTFAEIGKARLFVYKPSSTRNYTIETSGSLDTYIYAIDPRLTAIINSENYNDDNGSGLNAKLTKALSNNTPYLIIYSTFLISNQSGDLQLKIYA